MESLNDGSPKSYERQCRASSRKRKSYLNLFDSDEDNSADKSKKIRSRDSKPPSKAKEDNCTGYFVASGCGPKAGSHPSVGIGEVAQSEYENSHDYNPNHYDKSELQTASPNPWVAECAHGFATLKWPVYTANQPPRKSHSIQKPDPYSRHEEQHAQAKAQPLIRAAWAGGFTVFCDLEDTFAILDGFKACVSIKACAPARLLVERMEPSVIWEKLPRRCLWPESFERRGGPTDDDIAVFFFPSVTKHESVYDSLVLDLIREDAALRTTMRGSELLLFTSVELPPLFTRFQGKLYLWGVFRGDQSPL